MAGAASGAAARVIVVGGGLAGLSAALRAAESGARCDIFSTVPCRRSGAVVATDGLPDFESPRRHFEE
ncbi:MAG TPA: FAD-binding protein, partial [Planctomycetota bacterium]|nr:FAD-binding protein [Planctomycetota bacterium]